MPRATSQDKAKQPAHSLRMAPITELKADPENARQHPSSQVKAIARSIEAFGFNAPILTDATGTVRAGHGRLLAAQALGLTHVPVISLTHLTDAQAKAYMLADNKLNDRSTWDDRRVALRLKELSELALDFDIEATGFEPPEIDLRIQSLDDPDAGLDDDVPAPSKVTIARFGDVWHLGGHRLFCGNSLLRDTYNAVLGGERAAALFTDPPYNVRIDGHATGKGAVRHREFAMASGEMTEAEFTEFLRTFVRHSVSSLTPGALLYICMDWRHMFETLSASREIGLSLVNLCIWAKTNGGMGSFYRSRHELVFVMRNGQASHTNNIELGRHGRNRTNVWNYAGANAFAARGRTARLAMHPTVKPLALVADAILDCTKRDDVVLDPFAGSGTTILAAERTGRRARAIELEPKYVDVAIKRWQRMTGLEARNADDQSFSDAAIARGIS